MFLIVAVIILMYGFTTSNWNAVLLATGLVLANVLLHHCRPANHIAGGALDEGEPGEMVSSDEETEVVDTDLPMV